MRKSDARISSPTPALECSFSDPKSNGQSLLWCPESVYGRRKTFIIFWVLINIFGASLFFQLLSIHILLKLSETQQNYCLRKNRLINMLKTEFYKFIILTPEAYVHLQLRLYCWRSPRGFGVAHPQSYRVSWVWKWILDRNRLVWLRRRWILLMGNKWWVRKREQKRSRFEWRTRNTFLYYHQTIMNLISYYHYYILSLLMHEWPYIKDIYEQRHI